MSFKKSGGAANQPIDNLCLDYKDSWNDYFLNKCKQLHNIFEALELYKNKEDECIEEYAFLMAELKADVLYSFFDDLYDNLSSVLYKFKKIKNNKISVQTDNAFNKKDEGKNLGLFFVKESLLNFTKKEK